MTNQNKKDSIASIALGYVGSEHWAQDKKKDDFNAGDPKCNKFVYDVLKEAGATAPKNGRWPLMAKEWASSQYITDWEYKGTIKEWEAGDVLACSTHVGIAYDGKQVISAGAKKVYKASFHDPNGLTKGNCTVRRYTGS